MCRAVGPTLVPNLRRMMLAPESKRNVTPTAGDRSGLGFLITDPEPYGSQAFCPRNRKGKGPTKSSAWESGRRGGKGTRTAQEERAKGTVPGSAFLLPSPKDEPGRPSIKWQALREIRVSTHGEKSSVGCWSPQKMERHQVEEERMAKGVRFSLYTKGLIK